jgi:amino acid adenylation domain-containing protein
MNDKKSHTKEKLAASHFNKEKEYWKKKMSGDLKRSSFPYDFKKTTIKTHTNEPVKFRLDDKLFSRLTAISGQSDVKLHMILVTELVILLDKYTNNKDIIIGSPIDKQEMEGEFVNSVLPLRIQLDKQTPFKDVLLETKKTIDEAFENQNYPINVLVYDDLEMSYEDEFPLFDVGVVLENIQDKKYIEPIHPNILFSFLRNNGYIDAAIEYNSLLYKKETIEQIISHLMNLMQISLFNPGIQLKHLDILSQQERRQLLVDFNGIETGLPPERTIYQLFEAQTRQNPHSAAVSYENKDYTYEEINKQVNRLARILRYSGVNTDQTVGIMLNRSPLMMVYILAVWKAGSAYIPIDIVYPTERIIGILEDSGTKVLLTLGKHVKAELAEEYHGKITRLDQEQDEIEKQDPADLNIEFNINALAYVIYTSGSTGKPKGVMVEHIGMMNHIQAKISDLQLTPASVIAQNSSHTFDISVWQFFATLAIGAKTVIYPIEIIHEPDQFISQLIKDKITVLEVVPSYLSVMLDTIDLSPGEFPSLKYILVTGEEVKPILVKRWFEKFPGIKMVNAYGPTEASDDITHYIMDKAPDAERISIGRPIQNLNIYVVDENLNPCPVGVTGEICVSGIAVGRGYLNDVEKTNRVFIEDPFVKESRRRLYKTGDLGSWLPQGNIEFGGRSDHQVKIRGFRIELGEIENALINHPEVKEAIVIDKEDSNGNKYLYAYLVTNGRISEIREFLYEKLPDHMVPSHFIQLEKIPLTLHGKVDRKALPDEGTNRMLYVTANMLSEITVDTKKKENKQTPLEENIIEEKTLSKEEIEQLLYSFNNTNTDYPKDKTVHELFAVQVNKTPGKIASVYEDKKVTYKELNEKANQLARVLRNFGLEPDCIAGLMVERSIETLIGMLAILKAGGAYLPIDSEYPKKRIEYMLEDSSVEIILADNQEEFPGKNAKIININDPANFNGDHTNLPRISSPTNLVYTMYTSGSTGQQKGVMIEHKSVINLIKGLKDLIRFNEDDSILSLVSISFDMSIKETLLPLTQGLKIVIGNSEERIDYSATAAVINREQITIFQGPPSRLQLIISQPQAHEILGPLKFLLVAGELFPGTLLKQLKEKTQAKIFNLYGPTEITVNATAKDVSGENALNIGKPLANTRVYILNEADLSLLPIGAAGELCVGGEGVARGYIKKEKLTAEKFIEDPFIKGERIYRTGDIARWLPDGNIDFIGRKDYQVNISGFRIELGEVESYLLKHEDIKQALVIVKENQVGNRLLCAYFTAGKKLDDSKLRDYLSREVPLYMVPSYFVQVEKMPLTINGKIDRKALPEPAPLPGLRPGMAYINENILKDIDVNESERINERESSPGQWLSPEERKQILFSFNDTRASFPQDTMLHEPFEQQAGKKPGNTAAIFAGKRLTYGELEEKANCLARILRDKGVRADSMVGLLGHRSLEMLIGMYGILKAGGAYLPIDPEYPEERINYILRDSRSEILLVTDNNPPVPGYTSTIIDLSDERNYKGDTSHPGIKMIPSALAVIFYTSGTTGKPKGSLVEHRSLVNRLNWMQKCYPLEEKDVIIQKTPFVFDVSIWELFWWGFRGAAVSLLKSGEENNPEAIVSIIETDKVTTMHYVPSMFSHFLEYIEGLNDPKRLASLRQVFVSGEALLIQHVESFNRLLNQINKTNLINLYGPTEAAVDVSYFNCPTTGKFDKIPIGKPIDNIKLFIVNRSLQLLPVGKPGELVISGVGLARGYLNQPQLTSRQFVNAPFLKGNQLYKTGDLAEWLPDGNIDFLGRIDHQVKINGIRIEPGEIESFLVNHKDIKEAVVIPKVNKNGNHYLCGYVVSEKELVESEIRKFLSRDLPLYMVPTYLIQLEKIPLTITGKADRKMLAAIDIDSMITSEQLKDYVGPRNETEEQLVEIWKEHLGLKIVGIKDNFFHIGGDSILSIGLINKINKKLNTKLKIVDLYQNETIERIAEAIEKIEPVVVSEEDAGILSELEQMKNRYLQEL